MVDTEQSMTNRAGYRIVEHLGELLGIWSRAYGKQLWAEARMTRVHRGDECAICGDSVGGRAYRPSSNLSNRMQRICMKHKNDPLQAIPGGDE